MELLTYYIIILSFLYIKCYSQNSVTQSINWPVPVDKSVDFIFEKNFKPKSELLIEISNSELSRKYITVNRKQFSDITTPYFVILKNITLEKFTKFSLSLKFFENSNSKKIIFRWFPEGVDRSNSKLINSAENIIYEETISFRKPWKLTMSAVIQEKDKEIGDKEGLWEEKYFVVGKNVEVRCRASDGNPTSRISLLWSERPRKQYPFGYVEDNVDKTNDNRVFERNKYNGLTNTIFGYFQLRKSDHNRNITCVVLETKQQKSITIKVNHKPTSAILHPRYNGYASNGSTIKCFAKDGYPQPNEKWIFLYGSNHSNPQSLFKIDNNELRIKPSAPHNVLLAFNCSMIYIDPLNGHHHVVYQKYEFKIGEKPDMLGRLSKAVIGAGVAGVVIVIIAAAIVIMLCRSKPKPSQSSLLMQEESPKYAGSLLAGSKSTLKNQVKAHNGGGGGGGTGANMLSTNSQQQQQLLSHNLSDPAGEVTDYNYDDMPRGRRPIKVVDDPVVYSTIVGTMQPRTRPSLDIGPIDRV